MADRLLLRGMVVVVVLTFASRCTPSVPACVSDSDCRSGQACRARQCRDAALEEDGGTGGGQGGSHPGVGGGFVNSCEPDGGQPLDAGAPPGVYLVALGGHELWSIDPVTSASSQRGPPVIGQTPAITCDLQARRGFVLTLDPNFITHRIGTVDLSTGKLIANPALDWTPSGSGGGAGAQPYQYSDLFLRSDGSVVGLAALPIPGNYHQEFRRIDPATGASTLIGSYSTISHLSAGDPTRDRIHVWIPASAGAAGTLVTMNALTGAFSTKQLANPVHDGAEEPIWGLHLRSDGSLGGVGTRFPIDGGHPVNFVAELDEAALTVTELSGHTDFDSWDGLAADPQNDRLYARVRSNATRSHRLLTINTRTGAVVTDVPSPELADSCGELPLFAMCVHH